MSITISDIAEKVGISKATVSLVLTGKASPVRVSALTRQKVFQAAEELNYVPSLTARALVKGKTNTLGLIIGDIHSPSFSELASFAFQEAEARGYHLLISVTEWNLAKELECIDLLLQRQVDGIWVCTKALHPGVRQYDYILRRQFPVVSMVQEISGLPLVAHDWKPGMMEALEYLHGKGYKRVGFIGQAGEAKETYNKRLNFLEACGTVGVEPVEYECSARIEDARQIGRDLARRSDRPEALIAYSELVTNGIIRGLRDMGLTVPKDIAVIGMDGTDMAEHSYLQITSITADRRQMAVQSIEILLDMIKEKTLLPKKIWIPTRLIVRESA